MLSNATLNTPLPTYRKQRSANGKEWEYIPTGQSVPMVYGPAFETMLRTTYPGVMGSRAVGQWIEDKGVLLTDVYERFGYNKRDLLKAQVRALITNDNLRPWFGPTTEEGFRLGIQSVSDQFEPMIGTTVDVPGLNTEWYQIQKTNYGTGATQDASNNYELRTVGQGAEIPVSTIEVSGKSVQLTTKGRGIQWTDQALSMPVSLVQMFLQVLGIRIGQSYYRAIALVLRDGYFDDNSDDALNFPAAVTSVEATPGGIITTFNATVKDLLRAKDKLEQDLGYPVTDIMANSNTIINFGALQWASGGPPVFTNFDWGAMVGATVHRNNALPEADVIFFNRQAALVRYVNKPFGTEDERKASQLITATYASMIDEVVIGIPESRLWLDLVF